MAPTDKDLYIKGLSTLGKGVPLYQPCPVQVGDVGFIDPHDGFFQKLYNIANPPANGKPGCPPPIKFESTPLKEQWDAIHLKKSRSFGVSSQLNMITKVQMQFAFSEVNQGECILVPGNIVAMERIEETGSLDKYMNDHLKWIGSTYNGDKGYEFSPKDLILVHRTTKTDRWAIAVNTSSEVVQKLTFNMTPAVGATVWGEWSTSSAISRHGPAPGKFLVSHENSTGALPPTGSEGANQTIFMRRIALRPPISFFGQPTFKSSRKPTALERFRATVYRKQDWWGDGKTVVLIKQDWWGSEERPDWITPGQNLPAAASAIRKTQIVLEPLRAS